MVKKFLHNPGKLDHTRDITESLARYCADAICGQKRETGPPSVEDLAPKPLTDSEEWAKEDPTTQRILEDMNIEVFESVIQSSDRSPPLQFTLWDFGGQNLYYTLHQTFLNQRAIYLLVMDITKALDSVVECWRVTGANDAGSPKTIAGYFQFSRPNHTK